MVLQLKKVRYLNEYHDKVSHFQQFGITIKESEILYRDIRFYTHGIATQIYGGNMALKEEEIQTLLKNAINKFLK